MGAKNLSPAGVRTTDLPIHGRALTNALQITYLCYSTTDFILAKLFTSQQLRSLKKKNESVKKSLEKSKNVLEENRKIAKRKICIKRHTFTIIAMNFVQEQLITFTRIIVVTKRQQI